MNGNDARHFIVAGVMSAATMLLGACGGTKDPVATNSGTAAVEAATVAGAVGPRLYVLDCGTIAPMDPALFNLKKE